MHKDFLKDNANRKLVFNTNTAFPLVSGTRVKKYIMKGYEIDSLELTKVLLSINKLKINSYEDLEKHLGGMYGENILNFTREEKEKEFSLDNILEKLNLYYYEEHEFIRENNEMKTILSIDEPMLRFQKLLDYSISYFEYRGLYYMYIKENDYVRLDKDIVNENPDLYIKDEINNSLYKTIFLYKFVHKIGDKYYSFYDKDYEYKVGNIQIPNNKYLYACKAKDLKNATYRDYKDKAILKCEVDLNDITNFNESQLEVTKLKVLDIKDITDDIENFEKLPF